MPSLKALQECIRMSFADPLNCFSKAFFLNRAPTSVQTRVVMCSERLDAPRTSFQCRPANSDLANETNRSRFGERGVLTFFSCIKEGSGRGKGDRGRERKERRCRDYCICTAHSISLWISVTALQARTTDEQATGPFLKTIWHGPNWHRGSVHTRTVMSMLSQSV